MKQVNDGGQVYPAMTYKKSGQIEIGESTPGLTLRQFYAAQAMQSFLMRSYADAHSYEEWAAESFKMADAMIEFESTSATAQQPQE